nr:hypothetical protein [Tanacetum cinerariifolium]
MSTPTFAETHNLVAFLEKPAESAGFEQIIDFLKSKPIHYALTVNPTIYVSCVRQFWATTKVKKVNDQEQIQALVDKNETWVIYQLKPIKHPLLINHQLLNPKQKPRRKQMMEAEVSNDESEDEEHIPTPSSDPLPSGENSFILNELMVFCNNLQEQSRSGGLRRLKKFGSGRRVKPLMEKDSLGAQEDASKQGRLIEEIDQNAKIALDVETQGRTNDDKMFRDDDVEKSVASTTDVTEDEITMAQALAALKSIKPKAVDKGKAKMIEPEVPIKNKDQMRIDEEYARRLEAKEQEASRLSIAQ